MVIRQKLEKATANVGAEGGTLRGKLSLGCPIPSEPPRPSLDQLSVGHYHIVSFGCLLICREFMGCVTCSPLDFQPITP
jgi:hypothetical protein